MIKTYNNKQFSFINLGIKINLLWTSMEIYLSFNESEFAN
jgi:hypothetical protein